MSDDTVAQRSGAPRTAPRQSVPAQGVSPQGVSPQSVPAQGVSQHGVPQEGVPQQPQSLLQQMEELMAALNADISNLKIEAGFSSTGSTEAEPEPRT